MPKAGSGHDGVETSENENRICKFGATEMERCTTEGDAHELREEGACTDAL